MIRIELPLPPKNLSQNARCHWRDKAKATASYRRTAHVEALRAMEHLPRPPMLATASVRVSFFFAVERRRDRDNFSAMLKAACDGFTDAGVWIDDSGVTHLPVVFGMDKENPRVEIEVMP